MTETVADLEENDESEEETALTPYFSAEPVGIADVRVRAGWLNGEQQWEALAIDATVGLAQAQQAVELALTWYQETVVDIAAAAEEDGDDE